MCIKRKIKVTHKVVSDAFLRTLGYSTIKFAITTILSIQCKYQKGINDYSLNAQCFSLKFPIKLRLQIGQKQRKSIILHQTYNNRHFAARFYHMKGQPLLTGCNITRKHIRRSRYLTRKEIFRQKRDACRYSRDIYVVWRICGISKQKKLKKKLKREIHSRIVNEFFIGFIYIFTGNRLLGETAEQRRMQMIKNQRCPK